MGFLSKLFGKADDHAAVKAAVDAAECPHTTLIPRWDSANDIGNEDLAVSYRCEGCGETFSREQAQTLRRNAADRLRGTVGTGTVEG